MAENTQDKEQISCYIERQLKFQFMGKIKSRGLTLTDVITELAREYVSGSRHEPRPTVVGQSAYANRSLAIAQPLGAQLQSLIASGNQKLLEMLTAILASGNDNAIKAVTANLEVFSEYARIKGEAGKAGKPQRAKKSAT